MSTDAEVLAAFAAKAGRIEGAAGAFDAADQALDAHLGPAYLANLGALAIYSIHTQLGEQAAWGAAIMGRQMLRQVEAVRGSLQFLRDTRRDATRKIQPALKLLVTKTEHPGAELARRVVRVARIARKAWRDSR